MSEPGQQSLWGLYIRVAVVGALIVLASVLGLWLGAGSVPFEPAPTAGAPAVPAPASSVAATGPLPPSTPLYFFLSLPPGAARGAVAEEIAMASSAGIHQYVVSVPLPWDGDMTAFMEPLNFVAAADPAAEILVHVNLDPPAGWLSEHPSESVAGAGVSLASEAWREAARNALGALVSALNAALAPERVQGYVIGCLEEGLWHRGGGIDVSQANQAGFQKWLKTRYADNAQFQAAWGDQTATLDAALIPDKAALEVDGPVFVTWPEKRPWSDFLAYTSETTASRILEFTELIKQIAGRDTRVIASYGYSLELPDSAAGHSALAQLLESGIDGFASPISYADRGLGGAGGLMGPVDSAVLHGKQWYLIDDTRTGIARDPATGGITRPRNVRPEDIYSVQQRNFAAALSHRIGLFWSDAGGEGRLHDAPMWQRFGAMASIYADSENWADEQPAPVEEVAEGAEEGLQNAQMSLLALVVDEDSRFVQAPSAELNDLLLRHARDSAARAGLPVKYYLLDDVISGKAPGAPIYLFLNAFSLDADERARLRAVLEQNRANAIWMYAPGYFNETGAAVENIAQLTGIAVQAFEGPAQTGSTYALEGKWMAKDEKFGERLELEPLFYIDDENADTLAKYTDSGKPSVATRFFEEGWGSVLCAEPSMTPQLLREILAILEVFLCYQPGMQNFYDAFFFGDNVVAIHAREPGERTLEFDRPFNIQDLIASDIGWQGRRVINLPLKTGDTRILKLVGQARE